MEELIYACQRLVAEGDEIDLDLLAECSGVEVSTVVKVIEQSKAVRRRNYNPE